MSKLLTVLTACLFLVLIKIIVSLQINVNEDFIINSYILNHYLIIARNQSIFECMTPVEEFIPIYKNYRWETSTNLRIFDTTCRLIPVRDCQTNLAENKLVIDRKSPKALEARAAINDFIDKTLNPMRFEQLLYKVDVLMGVSCAYQQVRIRMKITCLSGSSDHICSIRAIKFVLICTNNESVIMVLNCVHVRDAWKRRRMVHGISGNQLAIQAIHSQYQCIELI